MTVFAAVSCLSLSLSPRLDGFVQGALPQLPLTTLNSVISAFGSKPSHSGKKRRHHGTCSPRALYAHVNPLAIMILSDPLQSPVTPHNPLFPFKSCFPNPSNKETISQVCALSVTLFGAPEQAIKGKAAVCSMSNDASLDFVGNHFSLHRTLYQESCHYCDIDSAPPRHQGGKGATRVSVASSVGIMNLVGCWFGGMPSCHGAQRLHRGKISKQR